MLALPPAELLLDADAPAPPVATAGHRAAADADTETEAEREAPEGDIDRRRANPDDKEVTPFCGREASGAARRCIWSLTTLASTMNAAACCLTFELRGRSRNGAWPARRMMTVSASRAKCQAGGGPAPAKG